MKYEVGKPHILACWIYEHNSTHFIVHYWATCSIGETPSDCEWIIPGTAQ
jgi:hypothetical protein